MKDMMEYEEMNDEYRQRPGRGRKPQMDEYGDRSDMKMMMQMMQNQMNDPMPSDMIMTMMENMPMQRMMKMMMNMMNKGRDDSYDMDEHDMTDKPKRNMMMQMMENMPIEMMPKMMKMMMNMMNTDDEYDEKRPGREMYREDKDSYEMNDEYGMDPMNMILNSMPGMMKGMKSMIGDIASDMDMQSAMEMGINMAMEMGPMIMNMMKP